MAVWWWLGGTTGQRCLTPHVQIRQQRVTYHFVLLLFYNILGVDIGDSGGDGGGHLSGTLERALDCGKLGVKISD